VPLESALHKNSHKTLNVVRYDAGPGIGASIPEVADTDNEE
jgi:hypothetical protein